MSYDVSTETPAGRRRLRRVANVCVGFGQRVQKSVFECSLSDVQYAQLQDRLLKEIDQQSDSLRIYRLREPREQFVKTYGIDHRVDFQEPIIV